MRPRSDIEGISAIVRRLRVAGRLTRTEVLRQVFGAGITADELGRLIDLGVDRGDLERETGELTYTVTRSVVWITLPADP